MVKFSSKMDAETLEALRSYARSKNQTLAGVLTEAVREFLAREAVRPVVRSAGEAVMRDHEELLRRLAE